MDVHALGMPDHPLIIAHRGASGEAPENTLAALQLAWKQGADGVECDVHLTSDCRIICLHDFDTKRVARQKLLVARHSFAELGQLDVGLWKGRDFKGERIPLLADALGTVPPRKQIYIEIKCGPEIVQPLLEQLDASWLKPQQITLICFDQKVIQALLAARPGLQVFWLIDVRSNWLGRSKLKLPEVLAQASYLGVQGLGLRCHSGIRRDMVERIQKAGLALNVWTVNDPIDARRYASFGVHSVTTNFPKLISEHLDSKNSV